jgi:glycosyltransferase involved in cell wall biosynthesis
MAKKRIRVLHLPFNVGNHPFGLSQAERKLGLDSHHLVIPQPDDFRVVEKSQLDKLRFSLLCEAWRWYYFLATFSRYDVFHFNFGHKFFHFAVSWWKPNESPPRRIARLLFAPYSFLIGKLDLWILKLLGKKIIVTFQGDDVRQGDVVARKYKTHFVSDVPAGYYDRISDQRKRRIAKLWSRYADAIYALNPDLLSVLPDNARFQPYAHVDPNSWISSTSQTQLTDTLARPIKILHAPSNRAVKGTRYLLEALDQLRKEGFEFEFSLIEGVPFVEAVEKYKEADLVVDQLLAGWYGGFAVEAMALGKPVISYIREEDLQYIPKEMRSDLPIINADKHTIASVLRSFLGNPKQLLQLGRNSRKFVERWHNPMLIAQKTIESYVTDS